MTGTVLAAYRIESKLGGGPLGEVYRAWDTVADRPVALRILARDIVSDRDRLLRFMDQVRAAAVIRHPNIAEILAAGESSGTYYVAFEYVEGEPLAAGMPVDEVLQVTRQICAALQAAHALRIPHRGIRPSNLRRTADGTVKLLDFGILKGGLGRRHSGVADAVSEAAVSYMSPEQVMDRRREIGRRTDLYSLGAVLYELLCGRPPLLGASPQQTLDMILDSEPEPPSKIRPDVPRGLERIVLRCLEKERNLRYQSIHELLYDLKRYETEPDLKPERRSRRTKVPVLWILLVLLSAGAAVLLLPWYARQRRPDSIAIARFVAAGQADSAMAAGFALHLQRQFMGIDAIRTAATQAADGESRAGRELGVATVLSGTVSKIAEDLTVTVRLIETADGSVLWTQRYDRRARDMAALAAVIGKAVAERLRPMSPGDEEWFSRQPTAVPEAFIPYARGLSYLSEGRAGEAVQYLKSAVTSDPNFALAHARLAEAYSELARREAGPPGEFGPPAREAAARAVRLDPAMAEAWSATGEVRHLFDLRFEEADDSFRKSAGCKPRYPMASVRYGQLLTARGSGEDAMTLLKKGRGAGSSYALLFGAGMVFALTHQFDLALTEFRAASGFPGDVSLARLWIAGCETANGALRQAQGTLESLGPGRDDDPVAISLRGWMYAKAGRTGDAERQLAALTELSKRRYVSAFRTAEVHAGLRNTSLALDHLEKASEQGAVNLAYLPKWPPFDDLHTERRFQDILRRIGFGPTAQSYQR